MLGVAHVVQLTHFELPNVLLLNVGCVIFCFFFLVASGGGSAD